MRSGVGPIARPAVAEQRDEGFVGGPMSDTVVRELGRDQLDPFDLGDHLERRRPQAIPEKY